MCPASKSDTHDPREGVYVALLRMSQPRARRGLRSRHRGSGPRSSSIAPPLRWPRCGTTVATIPCRSLDVDPQAVQHNYSLYIGTAVGSAKAQEDP